MSFLIDYWFIIVIVLAAIAAGVYYVYNMIKKPSDEQLTKVKEWLLFAVAEAEKELGSGTGQIKLRYVYDKFLIKFPYLVKIISFDKFSSLVDEVLEKFKVLLAQNNSLKDYINK